MDRDGWTRGKGVEFAEFLGDPSCAPEGGTAAKLTGCSDDQPVQTTLLSGCWRQPSSPLLTVVRISRNWPLIQNLSPRAHPSLIHKPGRHSYPLFLRALFYHPKKTRLRKARFFRSSKKTAVRLFLSRGRDQPERVRHAPYKLL